MKASYVVALAAVVALVTTLLIVPMFAHGDVTRETMVVYVPQPTLTSAQIIWLARLMQCESGLRSTAVNPKDLDNTPSYGLLQFKPSTFAAAAKQFALASTTDYMNPESQVDIVTQWILKGGINWSHQFPGCTAKLGLPPQ